MSKKREKKEIQTYSWLNTDFDKEKFTYDKKRLKRCPVGQTLNPKTYRCVKETGPIGRKLMGTDAYYQIQYESDLLFDPTSRKQWIERRPNYNFPETKQIQTINRVIRGHLARKKLPGYKAPTLIKRKNEIVPKIEVPKNKCKENQIINPKTGRCVKKDGAIGKSLLK
jgi:hypothetical protein